MRLLWALIWKESREQAHKIFLGLGFCLALLLLRLDADFNMEFIRWDGTVGQLFGLVAAVLLAVEAVAGERQQGTWAFLASRPLALGRLLAVKFAVGALGFLLLMAAYLAVIYALPFPWHEVADQASERYPLFDIILLHEYGYGGQLFLYGTGFLMVYAFCFWASAWSNRPVLGLINGLAATTGALLVATAIAFLIAPQTGKAFYNLVAGIELFGLDTSAPGYGLRLLHNGELWATRLGLAVLVVWLTWRLAAWGGARLQGPLQLWPWGLGGVLVGWCTIFVTTISALLHLSGGNDKWIDPMAKLDLQGQVASMALSNNRVCVILGQGRGEVSEIVVADLQDGRGLRQVGRLKLPDWRFLQWVVIVDSTAYVLGRQEQIVEGAKRYPASLFAIDLSGPEAPLFLDSMPMNQYGNAQYMGVYSDVIYIVLWNGDNLTLQTFTVASQVIPQPSHSLQLYTAPESDDDLTAWERLSLGDDWGEEFRIIGQRGFVVVGLELVVLDLSDPLRPVEVGRTQVEHVGRSAEWRETRYTEWQDGDQEGGLSSGAYRWTREKIEAAEGAKLKHTLAFKPELGAVAGMRGGQLFVERSWPEEMVAMDLDAGGLPVETGYALLNTPVLHWLDDVAYQKGSSTVDIWPWEAGGQRRPGKTLRLPREEGDDRKYTDYNDVPVYFTEEYICTVLDNKLVLFPPWAERRGGGGE